MPPKKTSKKPAIASRRPDSFRSSAKKPKATVIPMKSAEKPIPVKPAAPPRIPLEEYFSASGKRKTAVSRVRLFRGKGTITINERTFEQYFPVSYHQQVVRSPLKLTATENNFNITVKVLGGGINAQADAVRHGISRALLEYDPGLRATLKRAGFLTRDARIKERKKPGLKRARRAPQFSKR